MKLKIIADFLQARIAKRLKAIALCKRPNKHLTPIAKAALDGNLRAMESEVIFLKELLKGNTNGKDSHTL